MKDCRLSWIEAWDKQDFVWELKVTEDWGCILSKFKEFSQFNEGIALAVNTLRPRRHGFQYLSWGSSLTTYERTNNLLINLLFPSCTVEIVRGNSISLPSENAVTLVYQKSSGKQWWGGGAIGMNK